MCQITQIRKSDSLPKLPFSRRRRRRVFGEQGQGQGGEGGLGRVRLGSFFFLVLPSFVLSLSLTVSNIRAMDRRA